MPIDTYDISYDQRIPVGRYDYFGVGATFWGDQAGSLNFGQYQGKISASYSKRMAGYRDKAHYLVFGCRRSLRAASLGSYEGRVGRTA